VSTPRAQSVIVPLLRRDERLEGVDILTWVPDIDYREFPFINIRRIGGIRNPAAPTLHTLPVIEMTVIHDEGLVEAEELYETALDVLYDAVANQTQTLSGHLQSMYETMGATQFSSLYQDSWRVQGLIRFSIRRPRLHLR
jgi:hypothetical protein